jgi:hypothetical protein
MLNKPTVPTRGFHLLWFWAAALFGLGLAAYFAWAEQRGIITWGGAGAILLFQVLPPCVLLCAVGVLFRRRWLRRKRATHAFEQRLQNLTPLDL